MQLSEQERKEMLEAAKPLIKWLNENCHPHCEAQVGVNSVALMEVLAMEKTDDFLKG